MSIIQSSFDELIAAAWLSTLYFEILEIFALLDSRCDSYLTYSYYSLFYSL